jgi:cell division septum initiation protein DivIVA
VRGIGPTKRPSTKTLSTLWPLGGTMLNPQTLREASFSLATTGWSPDAVDAYLGDLADQLEAGTVDWMLERTRLKDREYRVESPGYVDDEVRSFFARVLESVEAAVDTTPPSTQEETVMSDEHVETDVDDVDEATEAAKAVEPPQIEDVAVSLDLGTLTEAIQRAKRTVAGLEAFVESDIAALKASCERQLAACQEECDRALEEARTKSTSCIADAESAAARVKTSAERETEKARRQWQSELQNLRETAEQEIASQRAEAEKAIAEIYAAAERDRGEAREAVERALDMQSSIAQSLEKARAELVPPSRSKRAA